MAIIAVILGGISVFLGIKSSLIWDIPTGPAIVVLNSIIFLFSIANQKIIKNTN